MSASSGQKRPSFAHDSDSDDDFVSIGTAVVQVEEDEPLKKPTTVQDLTARDKQGRRRFHGAFTGGFSAGYFNSVGTKEGFTPSTFVSSRDKKHEQSTSRPEDFMDEEDLEEHGIAPRKFVTQSNYTSEERKRKREEHHLAGQPMSTLSLGTSLLNLISPENLPVGMKLLRKMGWREGQGIGPRKAKKKIKTKKKAPKPGVKTYGCALPPSDDSDSDSYIPETLSEVTFAPKDVNPMPLEVKDNVHGLGYRGMDPGLALRGSGFSSTAVKYGKSTRGIRGQAFGVGAFEDEDEDIYSVDNMSNYDMTMQDEQASDSNFGWTAPRAHGKQTAPVDYVGKILEGFSLSKNPPPRKKKFPCPELPRNFRPVHWFRKKRGLGHLPSEPTTEPGGAKGGLTAVDRGLLLGETPVMESVFDLVPKKDKDRISATQEAISMTKDLAARHPTDDPPTTESQQPESQGEATRPISLSNKFKPAETRLLPTDPPSQGDKKPLFSGAFSIQPFRREPAKQRRYDQYTALLKQGHQDPFAEVSVPSMTEWEKSREREEFSKAAKLFRPMSAMMATRFVTSGTMIDEVTEDEPRREPEQTDQMQAAEMKMFGKLTRTELEWHPDKVLCKRFNIPNPYPGSEVVGVPSVKRDKFSVFNFLSVGDYQPKEDPVKPGTDRQETKPQDEPRMRDAIKGGQRKTKNFASLFDVLDDPKFHKQGVFGQGGASQVEEKDTAGPSDRGSSNIKPSVTSSSSSGEAGRMKGPATTAEVRGRKEDQMEVEGEDGGAEEEGDENPSQDLFRAIFKNSDSEDSDSDEDDKKEGEGESSESDDGSETQQQGGNQISGITGSVPAESKSILPGVTTREQETRFSDDQIGPPRDETGENRVEGDEDLNRPGVLWADQRVRDVAHTGLSLVEVKSESDEEEFGPKLPPPCPANTTSDSPRPLHLPSSSPPRREKHRHKEHKHRKERRDKKKSKKQKKEKKKKRHKSRGHHRSDSDSGEDSYSTGSDVSDSDLLQRLKKASQNGASLAAWMKKS